MYKVLLVDDEYYAREALKGVVQWETWNCTIIGEANNGVQAIEKARELTPDIVFADISMPLMDGLEMIQQLQTILPYAIYAIITGYSEFEYAKRGMELGVKYYVLKPPDSRKLTKIVLQMVEELESRKIEAQEYHSLNFWARHNMNESRRKFLQMLIEGKTNFTRDKFLYECDNLQLSLQKGGYGACCIKMELRTSNSFSQEEWEGMVTEVLQEAVPGNKYFICLDEEKLWILFAEICEQEWNRVTMLAVMQKMQIQFMQKSICTMSAGVGSFCQEYIEIPEICAEAERSTGGLASSEMVSRVVHYIHKNYKDVSLNVNNIANELFVNYSYLSSQFNKEMGMSASQYILRFRMGKAAEALKSGEENMIKVASDVGYIDERYFYRCFKKAFGVTPHQYVEKLQEMKKNS